MPKTYQLRVLSLDPNVCDRAIRLLTENKSLAVGGVHDNGNEVLDQCKETNVDLVLICVKCTNMSMMHIIRSLRLECPNTKLVVTTECSDLTGFFTAMQNGVQGYLHMSLSPEVWLQYLIALLDDQTPLICTTAARCIEPFIQNSSVTADIGKLTLREIEILKFISQGETNKKIAERLHIAENTVRNHVKNILAKLSLQNRIQLTAFAVKNGIYKSTG